MGGVVEDVVDGIGEKVVFWWGSDGFDGFGCVGRCIWWWIGVGEEIEEFLDSKDEDECKLYDVSIDYICVVWFVYDIEIGIWFWIVEIWNLVFGIVLVVGCVDIEGVVLDVVFGECRCYFGKESGYDGFFMMNDWIRIWVSFM